MRRGLPLFYSLLPLLPAFCPSLNVDLIVASSVPQTAGVGGMLRSWLLAPSSGKAPAGSPFITIFLGGPPPPIKLPQNSPHTHSPELS